MGRPSWSESNVWQISAHFMHSDTVIMNILFVEFLAQSGHPQPFCVFSLNFAILSVSVLRIAEWVCQFVQRMIESWRRRAVPTVREKCPSNSILISVEFISSSYMFRFFFIRIIYKEIWYTVCITHLILSGLVGKAWSMIPGFRLLGKSDMFLLKGTVHQSSFVHMLTFVFIRGVVSFILVIGVETPQTSKFVPNIYSFDQQVNLPAWC